MSRRSVASRSTVMTVDDVMSQLHEELGDCSLTDTREFIRSITRNNHMLRSQSLDQIEAIENVICPITANPKAMVLAMAKANAMIGGPQATSLFFPVCDLTSCSWDIFCHQDYAEDFVDSYKQSSNADFVEETGTGLGPKVIHFKKSINGTDKACKIRIFVSNKHPLESILNLKHSYEHGVISACAGIFFWPTLQKRDTYRVFDSNTGIRSYPKGNTYYQNVISPGTKVSPKVLRAVPGIYTGIQTRVESIAFKNTHGIDNVLYNARSKEIQNIVYCVYNNSCKYLGTISEMD